MPAEPTSAKILKGGENKDHPDLPLFASSEKTLSKMLIKSPPESF